MLLSRFVALIPIPTLLGLATAQAGPVTNVTESCANTNFADDSYYSEVIDNYINFWEGNYSRLDTTFSPDFVFTQDRLPDGPQNQYSAENFEGWVKHSHLGWSSLSFSLWYWFGSSYKVAIRWNLTGIISNASVHYPTASVAVGTKITYNGTDILFINACTGKLDQVNSALDLIQYFHELGTKSIATVE